MNDQSDNKPCYTQQLLAIRDAISEIDGSLISLIAKRRDYSLKVANIKQAIDKPLRDQQREKELLESLVEKASQLNIESRYITKIFTTIIEDSVRYQQEYLQSKVSPKTKDNVEKSVAVLGGVGAYSHLAAKQFFDKSDNRYVACDSFAEIINKVENGQTQYGVIPIENTTSGGITEVYDLLLSSKLQIVGEEKLAINHCLVTKENIKLNQIATIVAHPQAAKQCSDDLTNITNAQISLCESTAHALSLVAANTNCDCAAIASEQAAELFGLKVLQKNIANQKQNFTRFMVLAKQAIPVALSVQSKTTIALSTGQQPGSLARVLALFESARIPLSKLESRPIPEKPWEQLFYIDLQGNLAEPRIAEALTALSQLCKFLKVFGSYPSENIIATKVSPDSVANASLKRAELNAQANELYLPDNLVSGSKLWQRNSRTAVADALRETVVDLTGTLIGQKSFVLGAMVCNAQSSQSLENLFNQLAECGLSICWLQNLQEFKIENLNQCIDSKSMSIIESLAHQYELSLGIEVKNSQQLDLVVAHKGTPRIAGIELKNIELLDSAGNQNAPVVIQQVFSGCFTNLLDAAEYILAKGNQQVILEIELDCSNCSLDSFAEISILKDSTHLPVIVQLVGKSMSSAIITKLIGSLRALGVNGVIVEFDNKSENKNDDNWLMITAKDFATIMAKLD